MKILLISFAVLIIVSLALSLIMNTMEINKNLAWVFFYILIITFIISLFLNTDNNYYILAFLFGGIIFSSFFAFRVMILTPPREYLEPEIVCGVYASTILKPSRGGGRLDHIININNRSFVFSDKKPIINFDGLTRGKKICLELKRWKDKPDELNLAQLISIKKVN